MGEGGRETGSEKREKGDRRMGKLKGRWEKGDMRRGTGEKGDRRKGTGEGRQEKRNK